MKIIPHDVVPLAVLQAYYPIAYNITLRRYEIPAYFMQTLFENCTDTGISGTIYAPSYI